METSSSEEGGKEDLLLPSAATIVFTTVSILDSLNEAENRTKYHCQKNTVYREFMLQYYCNCKYCKLADTGQNVLAAKYFLHFLNSNLDHPVSPLTLSR